MKGPSRLAAERQRVERPGTSCTRIMDECETVPVTDGKRVQFFIIPTYHISECRTGLDNTYNG